MQNGISLESISREDSSPGHLIDYAVLATILCVNAIVFFFFAFTPILKSIVLIAIVLWYLLWGLVHHYRESTLTWKIISEYIGFSLFLIAAIVVGTSLLF